MHRKNLKLLSLFALLGAVMVSFALPAQARDHVSRGEATSLLRAWNNGRIAVSINEGVGAGHFEDVFEAGLLPFDSFDGSHYCEDDHIAALLAWISSADNRQDAAASLDTIAHEIIIDGQSYPTIRTPVVQRALADSESKVFAYSEGAILAPGDLSVGMHTLDVPIYFDGVFLFTASVTFFIDASGTGACQ